MSNELEVVLFPCLSDNYGILIHDNASGETVSIDTPEVDKIEAACSERKWNLTQIWNTHHHADHTGGNLDLKKKFGTKIYGPGIVKGRIPGLSNPLFGEETLNLVLMMYMYYLRLVILWITSSTMYQMQCLLL